MFGQGLIFGGFGVSIRTVEYLIVAGGGAGGNAPSYSTGGGGAGGMLTSSTFEMATGTYTITVGGSGNDSSIGELVVATAGGFGAQQPNPTTGGDGGSGGGSAIYSGNRAGGLGIAGQGNNGGTAQGSPSYTPSAGSGGGGKGAVGGNSSAGSICNRAGDGGDGITSPIRGSSVYYAGGGGASQSTRCGRGYHSLGGLGGGAPGGQHVSPSLNSTAGAANTGGGGGGKYTYSPWGNSGGSGIVVIRYLTGTATGTGGTITTVGSYTVHSFLSTDTFILG